MSWGRQVLMEVEPVREALGGIQLMMGKVAFVLIGLLDELVLASASAVMDGRQNC